MPPESQTKNLFFYIASNHLFSTQADERPYLQNPDTLAKMLGFQTELFYFDADLKIEEKVKKKFFLTLNPLFPKSTRSS